MSFLILVALLVALWLLWTISRNTADALDKQTAVQYEIIALEKRVEELGEALKAQSSAEAKPAKRSSGSRSRKQSETGKDAESKKEAE